MVSPLPVAVMASHTAHALVVMFQQMASDGERVALFRLPEVVQHHLQREQRLAGSFSRCGVETDAVHQRVDRAAENDREGRVVHMAVVVDPVASDCRLEQGEWGM